MKKITTLLLAVIIFAPSLSFAQYTNAVRIKIEGNGYSDEAIIRLITDATPNFDAYYDAYKMVSPNPSVPTIFSKLACSNDLSINSLPLYNKDTAIEIHTLLPAAGFYTITLEEVFPVDSDYQINLKDVNSGEILTLNTTTQIYLEPNNLNNLTFWFELSKILATNVNEQNNSITEDILNKGNGNFEIHFNNSNTNKFMVFDVTGKIIIEKNNSLKHAKIDLTNQPRGIYFIKTGLFTHKVLR